MGWQLGRRPLDVYTYANIHIAKRCCPCSVFSPSRDVVWDLTHSNASSAPTIGIAYLDSDSDFELCLSSIKHSFALKTTYKKP